MDKEAIVVNVIQEQDGKSVELKLYVHSPFVSRSALITHHSSLTTHHSCHHSLIFFFFTSRRPNGKTFSVPPHDMLIPTPQIGDIVSFTFENNARVDIPVHPRVFRRREDLDWEEVVQSSLAERKFLNGALFFYFLLSSFLFFLFFTFCLFLIS